MKIPKNNGDMFLCYSEQSDEIFVLKRGCLFSYYILETSFGTTVFKEFKAFVESSSLLENYVVIDENF